MVTPVMLPESERGVRKTTRPALLLLGAPAPVSAPAMFLSSRASNAVSNCPGRLTAPVTGTGVFAGKCARRSALGPRFRAGIAAIPAAGPTAADCCTCTSRASASFAAASASCMVQAREAGDAGPIGFGDIGEVGDIGPRPLRPVVCVSSREGTASQLSASPNNMYEISEYSRPSSTSAAVGSAGNASLARTGTVSCGGAGVRGGGVGGTPASNRTLRTR